MTVEHPLEEFDCIRFVREIRARNDEETKDMSSAEFRRWLDSRRPTHPVLAAAWDRAMPPVRRRIPILPSDR